MPGERQHNPDERRDSSHPQHDQWVQDVAKVLNIDLQAVGSIRPDAGGAVQMRDLNEEDDYDDDLLDDEPIHRSLPQQTAAREGPKEGSPIKVQENEDGTMTIDPFSVPAGINVFQEGDMYANAVGNTFVQSEHGLGVGDKIGAPLIGGAIKQKDVLAYGSTGVLQDFPAIENAVVKRPNAVDNGPVYPPSFVGATGLLHEAKILTALAEFDDARGAEHIVKIKGSGVSNYGEPFVVIEKLAGGNLESRLPDDHGLPPDKLNFFAESILSGLAFLHQRNIFHQDLKLDNIMFRDAESDDPVIIDFDSASAYDGLAADYGDGVRFGYNVGGATEIQPPERFGPRDQGEQMTTKVDCWAAGLMLVAAAAGKVAQQKLKRDLQQFRDGKKTEQSELDALIAKYIPDVPNNIQRTISGLMRLKVEERFSAEEAIDEIYSRGSN